MGRSTRVGAASRELFSAYQGQQWHPAQPLAVVNQWFEGGGDTGNHQHEDFHALYVVLSGRGIHVIDGHPYPITRGDVYMTPPSAVHRYRDYHRLRATAFCFQADLFSAEELDALRALPGFWSLFVPAGAGGEAERPHYQLHLSPERHDEVAAIIGQIAAEMERPTEATAPLLVRGLLFRLLVYLARAQPDDQGEGRRAPAQGRGPILTEVLRVCEERYAEPLTVPQLAALMFLSPGHFSEVFSREVGLPPAAYLRRLRLERAQTLLRATDLSATEIAHRTGFADSAQFSRAFRAALGITPSAYRKNPRPTGQ